MSAKDNGIVVIVRDVGVEWLFQLIAAYRTLGVDVGLVTPPEPPDVRARLDPVVDVVVTVEDATDPAQIADAARRIAEGRELRAVISAHDTAIVAAAQAAEILGVGRTPSGPIANARNKFKAREIMSAAGLATPGFALIGSDSDPEEVAKHVGMPAIVKPINGAGSHLISRVSSATELAEAYRVMAEKSTASPLTGLYRRPLDGGRLGMVDASSTFLVEGLLRGPMYCIDLIVRNGEIEQFAMADEHYSFETSFVTWIAEPPVTLAAEREPEIRAVADAAARALGLDNTVAHIEIIDDGVRGPVVVEVNPGRPGGQPFSMLYQTTKGIDGTMELAAVSLDLPSVREEPQLPMPAATLTICLRGSGRVRAINGLDRLYDIPDVLNVIPLIKVGSVLSGEFEMYAISVLVAGFTDAEDLEETYRRAESLIDIELEVP